MPDPILRRCEASATVYWEVTPEGPAVSRLVVDCPLPVLETMPPAAEKLRELQSAAVALVAEIRAFLWYPADADAVVEALAAVEAHLPKVEA